jgi:hypothetical protein
MDGKRFEELSQIAANLGNRIDPDEWRFAFHPFSDDKEILGCFMWEYIREHPDLKSMDRAEFVYGLMQSYNEIEERRKLNLFYKGIPARIVLSLLKHTGDMEPWLTLSKEKRDWILNTQNRPPLIPVEMELDLSYRWCYIVPDIGYVAGNEAARAYYGNLENLYRKGGDCKKSIADVPRGAVVSRSKKLDLTNDLGFAAEYYERMEGRDMIIARLRERGLCMQPEFLVNFLDHDPETLKRALSDWIDAEYPKAMQIKQKRGTKISDIKAHLKELAVMRLTKKISVQKLHENELRKFDETSDRDFYTDRKKACQTFSKYFSRELTQLPLNATMQKRIAKK